ncbi:MAG: hypothetical protein EOP42_00795 [Sphingobacteriaceae bacterium]|nr:MAG: hypothetical protein EOP42_00795 [Sphingobacteriaceae bacterium]
MNNSFMNKAYIILVHKKPQQLVRLIKTLDDGSATFFIHIDKSVPVEQFALLNQFGNKVKLVERIHSKWSTFGLVECTLNGLKTAYQCGNKFDRIILLSGQDYPIKSNEQINTFLQESRYSNFLEYWPLPNYEKWPNDRGGMYRIDKYFFGLNQLQLFLSRSINFLGNLFPFLRRKLPANMRPYAGSQWWIIDNYALNYIVRFVEENPKYSAFHKYTFGSDELYFQMILLNSQDEKILNSIENNNKRFMKWKTAAAHPDLLKAEDLSKIKKSNALFARKFDLKKDKEILDLIDKNCLLNRITA